MKTVYVMRGISGSGKSTYVNEVLKKDHPSIVHISQDFFWVDESGNYNFQAFRMGEAVNWAFHQFMDALDSGSETIVVDNVNAQRWHYSLYVRLAKKYSYRVIVCQMPVISKSLAFERNVHSVPDYVIQRQIDSFERESELTVRLVE